MSTKPKIYGFCTAGCKWEAVHKEDFLKACSLIKTNADTDGRWQLDVGEQYKIKSENVPDVGYGFTITFKYNDNGTETEYNFTIPHEDKYANYVVFRFLEASANITTLTLVYEIAGVRYSEEISGTSISLLDNDYLYIENAEEVFIYNPDASYIVSGDGGNADLSDYYTKEEVYTKKEIEALIAGSITEVLNTEV